MSMAAFPSSMPGIRSSFLTFRQLKLLAFVCSFSDCRRAVHSVHAGHGGEAPYIRSVQQNRSPSRWIAVVLGWLAIVGVLGLALAVALVGSGVVTVPNHLNPFTPLRIADEVNWLTRLKLSRLERNAAQCSAVLAQTPLTYKSVPNRETVEGCGLSNAVEVNATGLVLSRSFTASCPLATAWALLEWHVISPAAREHLGRDVMRVVHAGTTLAAISPIGRQGGEASMQWQTLSISQVLSWRMVAKLRCYAIGTEMSPGIGRFSRLCGMAPVASSMSC